MPRRRNTPYARPRSTETYRAIAAALPRWHDDARDWPSVADVAARFGVDVETMRQRLNRMAATGLVLAYRAHRAGGPRRYALTEKGARELIASS